MASITAEGLTDAPHPRAGLSLEDLSVGDSVVSVWRVVDGERSPVRGGRRITVVDSGFLVDYDVPFWRPVTYELEVLSGPGGAVRVTSEAIRVEPDSAWLTDPLDPQSAVPVFGHKDRDGRPYLREGSFAELSYGSEVSLIEIMGGDAPMALSGRVQRARGVPLALTTRSAEQAARLRTLLLSTSQLLFRPIPAHGWDLPGTMFLSAPVKKELPVDVAMGGSLTWWDMTVDTVQAPVLKPLRTAYTWGDVELMFGTWQQKQDAVAGTYLDDLKNPLG